MSDVYDASRVANFGRDTSSAYSKFVRSEQKLIDEINDAIDNGVKPVKIAHDVMGRCRSQEDRLNLLSVLVASSKMGRIPESVLKPFEEGIRARRI